MVTVIALTFHSLSLLDPVLSTWCVIFQQYFMNFWVMDSQKGQNIYDDYIYRKKIQFLRDLHIKIYHLNHCLLSLYGFKYLHYSVTLLSRGWNSFPCVCSDFDILATVVLPNVILCSLYSPLHIGIIPTVPLSTVYCHLF